MALKTINDLTALTTPASTDLVGVWAVGAARMRKSTIAQTFSPMLAVANVFSAKQTMDALLALKKNVAPGTTSGYLELGTDSNGDLKVQNDAGAARTLAGSISGGGTVATAGYTMTVPATGTAALLGIPNLFTDDIVVATGKQVRFDAPETSWATRQDGSGASALLLFVLESVGLAMTLSADGVYPKGLTGGAVNVTVDANGLLIRDPSDQRLKTDIVTIDTNAAIDVVDRLRPVRFHWLPEANLGGQLDIGLIAQEVQSVMPELVSADDSDDAILSVRYNRLLPLLISYVQQLSARIANLELA